VKAKRIAILESRLGRQLAGLVVQRGGVPFHAPALAEPPDLDPGQIAALVDALEARPAKLFIFQTGVGTRALFAVTDSLGVTAARSRPGGTRRAGDRDPDLPLAVFTNAEQVRNLFAVAEKSNRRQSLKDALNRTLVASIGPVASAALRENEVSIGLESRPPKLGALMSALDSALS
jgi:uroporphyrinogen-III synthase